LHMLISAVSEMNRRSNAFQFVYLPVTFSGNLPNADSGRIDPGYLLDPIQIALGGNMRGVDLPDYLLVGSISELDREVTGGRAGIGLGFGKVGIDLSADRLISVMTADFNVADGRTLKIISGATTTSSVALVNHNAGADLDAKLGSSSGNLTLSIDRADGQQAAMRALIQLSAIETLGKLSGLPYQQCLHQGRTSTGAPSHAKPFSLHSMHSSYRVGDKLVVQVRVSHTVDLFCYYQNAMGKLWQVLPTDYQPGNRAAPGVPIGIPGTSRVDLVLDAPGQERLMCLAIPPSSSVALASMLPGRISRTDLQPLSVSSLDAIEDAFRAKLRSPEGLRRADLQVWVE
jgi:hypothetical protein